ncbi:type III pantothenate kinase [Solicola gregarius]|uniref:Type III pantothenate kinase n=1 Tax=Solicola gregarius TaxID=2908642 RepID=A0AA46TKX7_9ACTN|nr:type III pantothenate kinase [Solicola gregarius]UYM06980.1 type III pantothenate kinase [Solicola gregarius]
MLLCIDVGNSHTVVGVLDGEELVAHWRVSTDEHRTADEWDVLLGSLLRARQLDPRTHIDGVSVCCTVPAVVHEIRDLLHRHLADAATSMIEPGTRTGLALQVDNPREVGADRIANALAASRLYGGPCIVVDFGTATTFDVVNAENQYVGGAISPGIEISLDALGRRGAQLRTVELQRPRSVIARNTVEALQSGLLYGFAGQVDRIVDRMIDALGAQTDDVSVIATGGLAETVLEECETVTAHEPWLTLIGLRFVHEKNTR